LAASLRKQLADVPGVTVRDRGRRLCGIVTFTIAGVSAADARARLHDQGINVWVSTVGTARLDLETRGIDELVRASVHYYNSAAEVERFVAAVRALNSKGAPTVGADR
jgi:cysteine desulfurase / selenocysteine lyase